MGNELSKGGKTPTGSRKTSLDHSWTYSPAGSPNKSPKKKTRSLLRLRVSESDAGSSSDWTMSCGSSTVSLRSTTQSSGAPCLFSDSVGQPSDSPSSGRFNFSASSDQATTPGDHDAVSPTTSASPKPPTHAPISIPSPTSVPDGPPRFSPPHVLTRAYSRSYYDALEDEDMPRRSRSAHVSESDPQSPLTPPWVPTDRPAYFPFAGNLTVTDHSDPPAPGEDPLDNPLGHFFVAGSPTPPPTLALPPSALPEQLRRSPPVYRRAYSNSLYEAAVDNSAPLPSPSQLLLSGRLSVSPDATRPSDVNLSAEPSRRGPSPFSEYININLAVIKKESITPAEADEFTKATLHGGIDEIMHKKEAIELKDIFKTEKGEASVKFILIEGAPGVGKSTTAQELCRKCHEIEAMMAFSAVVLLPLRDKEVQEARSVSDLLYHVHPGCHPTEVAGIYANDGEEVLFILDGFDEVPLHLRKTFFLAQVISGKYLPKATVLVTSRPSARADLIALRKPHKHVEVLGFAPEMIEQYATSIFRFNPPLLADFLDYISTNPAIKSMMYIPLNSAIVVEIYLENAKVGKPVPQTMTQLYSELVLIRIQRYFLGKGETLSEPLPDRLEDLGRTHPEINRQLVRLAKLSFPFTLKQEVMYEEIPQGWSTLGLMTTSHRIDERGEASPKYHFFHHTLQEFISSFYISQLPGSKQKDIFEQYSAQNKFSHMDVVWKFLAGLTGFRDIGWDMVHSRRGDSEEGEVGPFIVQCLYEAQEKADCKAVLGTSRVTCASTLSSTFDCFAVGYCVAVSSCTWNVDLSFRWLGPELVGMLMRGLRSQVEVGGTVDKLNLSWNSIGKEGMEHLRDMPPKVLQELSHLVVRKCTLDGKALDVLSDITPMITNLEHLDISENPAHGGTMKVLQTLSTLRCIRTLNMTNIPIVFDDIASLSYLIQSGTLNELMIGSSGMEPACEQLLLETVFSPSSLKHLGLWCVDLTPLTLAPLKANQNIVNLQVAGGAVDLETIAEILHENRTLQVLSIGYMDTGNMHYLNASVDQSTGAFKALSHALKVNRSLKVLKLRLAQLGREGVRCLVDALDHNRVLEHLELSRWYKHFCDADVDSRVMFTLK